MQEELTEYLAALSTCELIGSKILEWMNTLAELDEKILRFESQNDATQVELQRIEDSLREAEEALETSWNEIRASSPDWKIRITTQQEPG
jgi:predicted  nucleic acid-binding Zn-ribbon protein